MGQALSTGGGSGFVTVPPVTVTVSGSRCGVDRRLTEIVVFVAFDDAAGTVKQSYGTVLMVGRGQAVSSDSIGSETVILNPPVVGYRSF